MKRTPLKRKAAKPKRGPAVTCRTRGCKRRPAVEGYCKTHGKREADRLFSLYIRGRDGYCRACGTGERLQCAHIVSRRYLNVRYNRYNAIALCAGCHKYYTEHPLEWERWVDDNMRPDTGTSLGKQLREMQFTYMAWMKWLALGEPDPDPVGDALAWLKQETPA